MRKGKETEKPVALILAEIKGKPESDRINIKYLPDDPKCIYLIFEVSNGQFHRKEAEVAIRVPPEKVEENIEKLKNSEEVILWGEPLTEEDLEALNEIGRELDQDKLIINLVKEGKRYYFDLILVKRNGDRFSIRVLKWNLIRPLIKSVSLFKEQGR